ncbi:xylulokinase [Diplonema papillatum]|nr:xylulokinase [Diplonema papillatum]
MSGPLFLGVDLGSQSLKLFITDAKLEPVVETTVSFDKDLPQYKTTGGFHIRGNTVTGPTLLWVEALERCFAQLLALKAPLHRVVAISGSAQQHGSVYWKRGALTKLQELDSSRTLTEQLGDCFATTESPVWMDSSTTKQCLMLERDLGGPANVAKVSGSRAFERFTANQIAKLLETEPAAMTQCERISLISSFLACLFTGGYAPIDVSDGSGMNLLDINTRTWSPALVHAVGSRHPSKTYNLMSRLGEVVESFAPVGHVNQYFAERYGLPKECQVIAFSGDNNNALVGLKIAKGDLAVSMGTSDTIFASIAKATPKELGHVFAHPIVEGSYMAMLCYANGSLTREKVRDRYVGADWPAFEAALQKTAPGNRGKIGYYFLNREIIPQGGQGVHLFSSDDRPAADSDWQEAEHVRAVVEGQFLSMRLHGSAIGLEITERSRIFVTGGGSRSRGILQVLADVFGAPVYKDVKGAVNSAAFGAAVRAAHGYHLLAEGLTHADSEQVYADMIKQQQTVELLASPHKANTAIYTKMLSRYESLETKVMDKVRAEARL